MWNLGTILWKIDIVNGAINENLGFTPGTYTEYLYVKFLQFSKINNQTTSFFPNETILAFFL